MSTVVRWLSGILAPIIVFLAVVPLSTAARVPSATALSFDVSATVTPAETSPGATQTFTVKASNTSGSSVSGDITITIMNPNRQSVHSRSWRNQAFAAGATSDFTSDFTLASSAVTGRYTLGVTIRGKGTKGETYYASDTVTTFAVLMPEAPAVQPSPTPTATPTQQPVQAPSPTAAPATSTPAPTVAPSPSPSPTPTQAPSPSRVYGVLQPQAQYLVEDWEAGIRLRTLELGWDLYEPSDNAWSSSYIASRKNEYQQMRAAGFEVALDFGLQYPPSWIFSLPNSRYVNQHGDSFTGGQGTNGVNAIFNQAMRDQQAAYVQRVFADFGTDFYAVRLGWGFYGEINYPAPNFNGRTNSYWAYDPIAQGKVAGLPAGMRPSPVPGWTPGTASVNNADAAAFIDWYMDGLKNYHDWQITTVRKHYNGKLTMLYSSWGVRPGQLEAAVKVNLNGSTSAEKNGEVQRGFDYARFVAGITDPSVIVYTTWLDASDSGDSGSDPANWSPVKYLASLAAKNPNRLAVWGESAGRNNLAQMERCFRQMERHNLMGLIWAFGPDLRSGQHATIRDYASMIATYQ